MKISPELADEAVLAELGRRLARTRLERNLTQAELGEEAGVGLATVQRLEDGQAARLNSLIRVLRVLSLLEALELLIPEPTPSPIERLKLQGKQRQRAAHPRSEDTPSSEPKPWSWGDGRSDDG
ncbi:MAG TPA: helix-turn-helix domain-containing protein [Dehalococcoidia bacterium]